MFRRYNISRCTYQSSVVIIEQQLYYYLERRTDTSRVFVLQKSDLFEGYCTTAAAAEDSSTVYNINIY